MKLNNLESFELVLLLKKCKVLEKAIPENTYNHRAVVKTIRHIRNLLIDRQAIC